jgi:hypothetical protein
MNVYLGLGNPRGSGIWNEGARKQSIVIFNPNIDTLLTVQQTVKTVWKKRIL